MGTSCRPSVALDALAVLAVAGSASACNPAPAGDGGLPPECAALWNAPPVSAFVDADAGAGAGAASPSGFSAQVWFSSESRPFQLDAPDTVWLRCPLPIRYRLARQPDLPITAPGGDVPTVITVDPSVTYQTILGIGGSMEESSVWNLRSLSAAKRAEILTSMLDPVRGMGLNLFRLPMGTSDFTGRPWYTYDDLPPGEQDPDMARFSIQKDIDYGIIDVVHEMQAIQPGVTFFASPWSPPGWMKTSGEIAGGTMLSQWIPALAKYFRRFVEAYRDLGVPIYAVTLQNEPRTQTTAMPTCIMSGEQEAQLVQAVKQEFAAGQLDTRAWAFDHNFDVGVDFAQAVYADPGAYAATDAVAFHDYAGDPSAMGALHDLFPGKDVVFTEKALWGVFGVDRAAQYFRNWSRTYVSWVTMLDQGAKPNDGPTTNKPRWFVRSVAYPGDEYYPTPEHYLFGLYSKFVKPGAKRIASPYGSVDTVTDVAFLNPDGTAAAIVINQTAADRQFAVVSEGNQIWADLPGKTAATVVWRAGLARSAAPPADPTR